MPPEATARSTDPRRLSRSDAWGSAYREGRRRSRPVEATPPRASSADDVVVPFSTRGS